MIIVPLPGGLKTRRVKFIRRPSHYCGHSQETDPPAPARRMSATLFGRGVMTQIGSRRRAEATDSAITAMRTELAELRALPTVIRSLDARLQAADRRIAALEAQAQETARHIATLEAQAKPAPAEEATTTST
jgi:hypothetical protein